MNTHYIDHMTKIPLYDRNQDKLHVFSFRDRNGKKIAENFESVIITRNYVVSFRESLHH